MWPRAVEVCLAVHSIDITPAMKPMKRRRGPTALHDRVQAWHLRPVVDALQALRGVQFTVAVTIVAALEGAFVLARAARSGAPFREVGKSLAAALRRS